MCFQQCLHVHLLACMVHALFISTPALSCCCCCRCLAWPAGGKHFSLVVTAHWQGDAHNVQHYAFKSVDNSGVQFLRPDNTLINKWKKGLQVCLCIHCSCCGWHLNSNSSLVC
jgi:hypothetical protein